MHITGITESSLPEVWAQTEQFMEKPKLVLSVVATETRCNCKNLGYMSRIT